MLSLVLWIALFVPAVSSDARASTVVLDGARYFELREPDPVKDLSAPPTPWVARRTVTITPESGALAADGPTAGGVRVHASWTLAAPKVGWFDAVIAGPEVRIESVRIDGQPAAIASGPTGTRVTAYVDGAGTLVLDGFVDGDPNVGQRLSLLPAVSGTIAATNANGRELVVEDGGRAAIRAPEGLLSTARDLSIVLTDPAPAADKPPLFVAEVAEGLTVRDGDVEGHAQVRWLVRQGELTGPLYLTVRGAGRDVTVKGDNVRAYRWEGDALVIEPERPVRDVLSVDLAWSVPVAAGDTARVSVPEIAPTGAFRVDAAVLIARDDAIEVVPEMPAWQPVATTDLPEVTTGLITGTPTSAWRGQGGGSLSILRVVPVEQPAVLVDVAALTLATNDEGRVLMRGYYTVRNERAPALRVVPPDGVNVLGVQVSGRPVTLGKDDGPGWLVPLPRSLETVDGLLSFPIEVIAFGTTQAWDKKEDRVVPLLRVEAPVAVQRVTLHLPPGYAKKNKVGEDEVVSDFTEGETISYGLAVGDVAAAEVDARFQEALDAWMINDFETAQVKLDELKALGGETENVRKLQSNLDVVDVDQEVGVADDAEDTTVARRVKDMARARATEEMQKREELITEAKEAERSGDYAAASASYSSAYAIGEKLSGLEQTESASFRGSNASVQVELEAVAKKAADKDSKAKAKPPSASETRSAAGATAYGPAQATTPKEPPKVVVSGSRIVIDFDALEISGELAMPEGEYSVAFDGHTAHEVPLVDLGDDGRGDFSQLATTAPGVIVLDPAPADPDAPRDNGVAFLAQDPSFVTGSFDEDTGSLGIVGYGQGGGGVGYGAIGVAVGGSLAGQSISENIPIGRDYDMVLDGVETTAETRASPMRAVQRMPGSSSSRGDRGGRGGGGGGFGWAKQAGSGSGSYGGFVEIDMEESDGDYGGATETPPPMPVLSIGGDEPDEPIVTAQSLSLVVPDLGETVLFQSVLLPEDAAPAVVIKAKRSHKATSE